jgi:hypothetical protein
MHIETPFIHHETLYRLFLFLLPHHQSPLLPLLPGPSPCPILLSDGKLAMMSSRYADPIHVHPLLDASLMEHPSTITRNKYSLTVRTLRESATTPPLPFLTT